MTVESCRIWPDMEDEPSYRHAPMSSTGGRGEGDVAHQQRDGVSPRPRGTAHASPGDRFPARRQEPTRPTAKPTSRATSRTKIELAGALSEPREQVRWERLARRLDDSPGRTPAKPRNRRLPWRQGWVWPAIRRVLAAADTPMRPIEIYAAVIEDLDIPVSKSTIKNELRRRLTMAPLELGQDASSGYFLISHPLQAAQPRKGELHCWLNDPRRAAVTTPRRSGRTAR